MKLIVHFKCIRISRSIFHYVTAPRDKLKSATKASVVVIAISCEHPWRVRGRITSRNNLAGPAR